MMQSKPSSVIWGSGEWLLGSSGGNSEHPSRRGNHRCDSLPPADPSPCSVPRTQVLRQTVLQLARHQHHQQLRQLYILNYAPDLKDTALETATSNLPPPSLSSSFSNIGHDQAQTPGEEAKSPL